MSLSIIDKYLETEMSDLDLYSEYDISGSSEENMDTYINEDYNKDSNPKKDTVRRNNKIRERVKFSDNSLVIKKDVDRVYDFNNNTRSAIEYRRYGQFLSLSNDASPDKKYVIDMFDLYKQLSSGSGHISLKSKKNNESKISNFFRYFK